MNFASTILCFLSFTLFSQQNLLKNPSFEIIDSTYYKMFANESKPFAINLKDWKVTSPSPDLFSDSIALNPPFYSKGYKGLTHGNQNFTGKQTPKEGFYYLGLAQYVEFDDKMVKPCLATESIAGELKHTLEKGKTYNISAYVSLSETSNSSLKEIKFTFSDSLTIVNGTNIWCKIRIDTTNSFNMYNSDSSWVNSKDEWVKIKGTYIAQGGEKYLNIGIPTSNPKLQNEKVKYKYRTFRKYSSYPSGGVKCYYYFDEVSVVQNESIYFDE